MTAPTRTLFEPGTNCAEVVSARRVKFLVDAEDYFAAFAETAKRAERSIVILAWDFDSRVILHPDHGEKTLGTFLNELCEAKPHLRIHILDWDYPMVYGHDREFPPIYGITWQPHRHIHFRYDDTHPLAGSHHQKIVVVDDRVAFAGGLDISGRRWDTSAHAAGDPRRVFNGEPYPPVHDVMIAVDGDAAIALGDIARRRWHSATDETLEPASVKSDPWPFEDADLRDVSLAIACTAPASNGNGGCFQVERLYLDMIENARHYIYLENQYFTSEKIGAALKKRLLEPKGPEIVLVTRLLSHGWLEEMTMHVLRTRLVRELRDADKHGRFHAFCPHIEGLKDGTCIDLHSKVMVVDDEWLRIGSSNISNRSMGMDTECDVVVEARQRTQVKRGIRHFRDRLIAEHLGADLEAFAEKAKKLGSMVRAIEAFGSKQRSLRPLKAPKLPEEVLEAAKIGDPEKPIALDTIVRQFSPEAESPRFAPGPLLIALMLVVLIGLAFIWRYTPLAGIVTPEAVIQWARSFASHWWAPLVIILAYTPAMVVMFPRPLITLTAVLTFGAWAGFAYAMTGVLLAALIGFFIGEFVKRDTVRRLAGPRLNKISHLLHRGGLIAVTIVRLLPIAPFVVVSVVMGAMRIRLPNYVIGTALGMTPGMLAATVLSDQFAAALVNPADVNGWAIAGAVLGLAMLAGMGHWWLGRGRRARA